MARWKCHGWNNNSEKHFSFSRTATESAEPPQEPELSHPLLFHFPLQTIKAVRTVVKKKKKKKKHFTACGFQKETAPTSKDTSGRYLGGIEVNLQARCQSKIGDAEDKPDG